VLTSVENAGSTAVGLGAFLERTSNILRQAIPLVDMSRITQSTGPHTTICVSVLGDQQVRVLAEDQQVRLLHRYTL
jgi:hypothetical protein